MATIPNDAFMLLALAAMYGYAFYWMVKVIHLLITMRETKGEAVANKKGEANLEKAKSRFRGAAWWFLGGVVGLIAGKFFVDAAMYFGMPAVPGTGPMKVWTIAMWSVLMGVYICLFGAFWMGLSIIRRKFKLRTSYDVTMGDVRIVKVDPELAKNLLPYEPTEEVKKIEMSDATAEVMASVQEAENG